MATSTKPPVNLQASYDESDSWGLRVELGDAFSFGTGKRVHTAKVGQRRATKGGNNEGKPTHLFTLAAKPDEDVPSLLRRLAEIWEAGSVEWAG